jgi:ATPase components of various ABC-type transport systems, contain duplicated ATPase
MMVVEAILSVRGLSKRFRDGARDVIALDDVHLDIRRGETLALVGGSGSGKSTLARILLRLLEPDAGSIMFAGTELLSLQGSTLRKMRGRIQMVFQDPLAAFNPRATVARVLTDPLRIHALATRRERPQRVVEMLERMGLLADLANRRIHEVSGGQRQRVAIARALATRPDLVVLDEALSALDVSVRAEIVERLLEQQRQSGAAYLFIAHDLALVRAIADRMAVIDAGRIVEIGDTRTILEHPQSAAARALIEAAPRLGRRTASPECSSP